MHDRLARANTVTLNENTAVVAKLNLLEKAIKEVLLHEIRYDCFYEPSFPMGENRCRRPDFVLTQLKVNDKFVILDPHHFGIDQEGKAYKKEVDRWIDFKGRWGHKVYIIYISHNTREEVENQTGTSCSAFCDVFWHVSENKNMEMIKQSIKTLLEDTRKRGSYVSLSRPEIELKHLLRG